MAANWHATNGYAVHIMKYLVCSDVHGNRFGLEAVLADAAGDFTKVLCLGDVVGYGAHPNQCCELLRERGATCLLGNHDAAALGLLSTRWFNPTAKAAIEWTTAQLTSPNCGWLAGLVPFVTSQSKNFQAVHGSLRQPLEEYITHPDIAFQSFKLMERDLCFFGHTHIAECYGFDSVSRQRQGVVQRDFLEGGTLFLQEGWKYLVNPGSCGQPRDGNPWARYAIFDSEAREIEVRQVDYDREAVRQAILDAGLPSSLGDRLLHGL